MCQLGIPAYAALSVIVFSSALASELPARLNSPFRSSKAANNSCVGTITAINIKKFFSTKNRTLRGAFFCSNFGRRRGEICSTFGTPLKGIHSESTFASCGIYASRTIFLSSTPTVVSDEREPSSPTYRYEPRSDSASPCKGHGAGRDRWGAVVAEGLHTLSAWL